MLILTHWHRLWLCYKFLCIMFSKGTHTFDFIKPKIIWTLTCKVEKYISQINGGLMFFEDSRIRFLKLVSLIVNNMQKINATNRTQSPMFSNQSVKVTFKLFKCHRSIDNSIGSIFLSCRERVHDNKEFSHENSKPCCESQILTR